MVSGLSVNQGELFTLQIDGGDPDNDPVLFTLNGEGVNNGQDLPQSITIDSVTGLIRGIFSTDADTEYEINVALAECSVQTATPPCNVEPLPGVRLATLFGFKVAVLDVNEPADIVDPGPQLSAEGSSPTLPIQASDPDDDALTFEAGGLPPGLTIDSDTGVISGSVGFDAAGTYAVTVQVGRPDHRHDRLHRGGLPHRDRQRVGRIAV